MTQRDNATSNVARGFRLMRELLLEYRQIVARQRFYLEEAMGLNEELNDAADKTQRSIDDAQDAVQKHSDKQAQIIADLEAKVAAGLTPEQASALLEKLKGSQADIQSTADALAEVATDPTTPAEPGETSVSVTKDTPDNG